MPQSRHMTLIVELLIRNLLSILHKFNTRKMKGCRLIPYFYWKAMVFVLCSFCLNVLGLNIALLFESELQKVT